MQSFPLKFTDHFERSNADCHRRSNIVFDLENRPYESQKEYNHAPFLHTASNQKLEVGTAWERG